MTFSSTSIGEVIGNFKKSWFARYPSPQSSSRGSWVFLGGFSPLKLVLMEEV
jgi:hypothetical protein